MHSTGCILHLIILPLAYSQVVNSPAFFLAQVPRPSMALNRAAEEYLDLSAIRLELKGSPEGLSGKKCSQRANTGKKFFVIMEIFFFRTCQSEIWYNRIWCRAREKTRNEMRCVARQRNIARQKKLQYFRPSTHRVGRGRLIINFDNFTCGWHCTLKKCWNSIIWVRWASTATTSILKAVWLGYVIDNKLHLPSVELNWGFSGEEQ